MKVSVCIPTYNQAFFLEQAVQSVLDQTCKPFEIIISNDCSTDGTAAVIQRLSDKIQNLKFVNQPINLGLVCNTDTVLRLATGDFIVRLDSDDCLAPSYIEKLGGLLEKHPEAGYAHAAVQEIDESGRVKKDRYLSRKSGFQSGQNALKESLKGYKVAANIIMFRKEAMVKINYMPLHVHFAEDYYSSVVMAAADFGNVYLDEILSYYRVWNDPGKIRQKRKIIEISGLRQVFDEAIEPAFKKRNWDLKALKKSRVNFACRQSDCLGWSIYNSEEKKELLIELSKLSSASKAKLFAKFYLNGFGTFIYFWRNIKYGSKTIIKSIVAGSKILFQ
jgi:glycosyltransferase involved in cell wall biosynthesis